MHFIRARAPPLRPSAAGTSEQERRRCAAFGTLAKGDKVRRFVETGTAMLSICGTVIHDVVNVMEVYPAASGVHESLHKYPRQLFMDYLITEIQPFDEFYKAFLAGGSLCLAAGIFVAFFQASPQLKTSTDGSGIALLLLLSAAVCLINKGLLARMRIRTDWGA
jgi:hypothetical protein